jgi:hypothetical protein
MNEPVALVNNMCNDSIDWKVDPLKLEEGTPLYTHPAKELLVKDILDVYQSQDWYEEFDGELCFNYLKFAVAILRKAQEK